MVLYKPPKLASEPQKYSPDRTSDYLAGAGSPNRVARRIRKEEKRAREEGRVRDLIVHAIQNSPTRDDAAKYLAKVSGLDPKKVYKALPQETFDRVKSSSEAPKVDYNFFAGLLKKLAANGGAVAAAVMLPLVGYAAVKIAKDPSWGAAAESDDPYEKTGRGRAVDNFGPLAQDYQDLDSEIGTALADGQLSVQERGNLQGRISELQSRQTGELLNYLSWLAENQTREGQNITNVSKNAPKAVDFNNPTSEWDKAAVALRNDILPARDSNLQGVGVDKPTAANYTPLNRLYQSIKEMAQAHLKNDAAVAEMYNTQVTVGPDKVSDIGTTLEKTAAPLLKLMRQLYDADPSDKDTFTEFLSGWLEAPDTWDFVNGVWKENPVQVLRAVRDFYNAKIAPAPYFTAVSDWAPIEKPINNPPVIDESSIVSEGTVKHGFADDVNASDPDGDPLTYRIISSPTGMEINPETGEISWMPTIGQIGENRVAIGVSDGKEETTYEWFVRITSGNAKPVIDPSSVSTEGSPRYGFNSEVNATDPDGDPLTYRIVSGPSGMGIDSRTGRISWSPSQNQMGQHEVVVGVSDGMDEAQYSWLLEITTGNRAPIVSEQDILKTGQTRHQYYQKFFVDDPDGDRVTSKIIQAPKGASLDTDTHTLTWTPNRTQAGNHTFVLEFTDGEKPVRVQYEVRIGSDNKAPKIIGQPTLLVREGERWVPAVNITDPDGDPITYELYINGKLKSNELGWTPGREDIGRVQYRLVARDNFNASSEISGEGNVLQNLPPDVQLPQTVSIEKGKTARVLLPEKDSEGDSLVYKIKNLPDGVEASIVGRELLIKGLRKGLDSVKLTVNDSVNEKELDVYYNVNEKVIAPNMLPVYLAAGALIAGAGAAGTFGAYRADRRVKVNQVFALDGPGRPVGSWDERGNSISDDNGEGMLTGAMLTAIRSFVKEGLKGDVNAFDYTLPVTGRPKVKLVIEGDNNLTIAAAVGTENPKKIRRVSRALKEALREGSPLIKGWEGDKPSPKVYSVEVAVKRNVYNRELNLLEWMKELAGRDSGIEIEEYKVPVIAAPPAQRVPTSLAFSKPPKEVDPLLAGIPEAYVPKAIPPPARKPSAIVPPASKPALTREEKEEILDRAIRSSSTPEEAVRKIAVGWGVVGRESKIRRSLPDEEFYRLKGVSPPAENPASSIPPPDDGGRALLHSITSSLPRQAEPSQRGEVRNLERIIERSLTYPDAVAEISRTTGSPPEIVRKKFSEELFNKAKAAHPTGLYAHETDSGVIAGETVIDLKDVRKRRLSFDPNSPLGRLLDGNG